MYTFLIYNPLFLWYALFANSGETVGDLTPVRRSIHLYSFLKITHRTEGVELSQHCRIVALYQFISFFFGR